MKDYPNIQIIAGSSYKTSQQVFQDIKELVQPVVKKKLNIEREMLACH